MKMEHSSFKIVIYEEMVNQLCTAKVIEMNNVYSVNSDTQTNCYTKIQMSSILC